MGIQPQIQNIPGALQVTLEKARAEYETILRQVRWGDGPIYVCGVGSCTGLGLAASYALETFLGRPVVVRPAEVFQTYGLPLLVTRSVLLMICAAEEAPEAQELAQVVHQRGATLLVLTNTADNPLAKMADHVFLVPAEGEGDVPSVSVCLHAALNFWALTVARLLKRHEPSWDQLAREFSELPAQIEWTFTQLSTVIRSLAAELIRPPRVRIVGGGFYHFPAWRASRRLEALAGLAAEAVEASEFLSGAAGPARRDDAVLFLSSSRAKLRKLAHRSAALARVDGARVLSITDANDRELAERSDLGLLVPALMEVTGSTLSLCLVEWLAVEAARAAKPRTKPPAPPDKSRA